MLQSVAVFTTTPASAATTADAIANYWRGPSV